MIQDIRPRAWRRTQGAERLRTAARGRRRAITPALEHLEGRRLLSFYTGPSAIRPVHSSAGDFLIQVGGPGLVKVHPAGHGAIDLSAFGTTADSTITVTLVRPRWHFPSRLLPIHKLTVTSGQLGSLDAIPAELTGKMTPLNNTVADLELGEIGPGASSGYQRQCGSDDRRGDRPWPDRPRGGLGSTEYRRPDGLDDDRRHEYRRRPIRDRHGFAGAHLHHWGT